MSRKPQILQTRVLANKNSHLNETNPQVFSSLRAHVSITALAQPKSQGVPALPPRPPYGGTTCGAQTGPHELPRTPATSRPIHVAGERRNKRKWGALEAKTGGPVGSSKVRCAIAPARLALAHQPSNVHVNQHPTPSIFTIFVLIRAANIHGPSTRHAVSRIGDA